MHCCWSKRRWLVYRTEFHEWQEFFKPWTQTHTGASSECVIVFLLWHGSAEMSFLWRVTGLSLRGGVETRETSHGKRHLTTELMSNCGSTAWATCRAAHVWMSDTKHSGVEKNACCMESFERCIRTRPFIIFQNDVTCAVVSRRSPACLTFYNFVCFDAAARLKTWVYHRVGLTAVLTMHQQLTHYTDGHAATVWKRWNFVENAQILMMWRFVWVATPVGLQNAAAANSSDKWMWLCDVTVPCSVPRSGFTEA